MAAKGINHLHWFGSTIAATIVLSLFGMAATLFIKINASFPGLLVWQIIFAFTYTPAIFAASIPLIWIIWKIFNGHEPHRVRTAILLILCTALLITAANLPYFHKFAIYWLHDAIIVLTGIAVNVAVFVWLQSTPGSSSVAGSQVRL